MSFERRARQCVVNCLNLVVSAMSNQGQVCLVDIALSYINENLAI